SSVPLFLVVGKNFLPQDDQAEFEVTVKMPPGSSLEGSASVMSELEQRLKTLPGVRSLTTTLGADVRRQVDRGSILVNLVPMEERQRSQEQLMLMARERIKDFRDLTIGVQQPALIQGAGSTAELQFFLQGPDLNRLEKYAQEVKAKLAQIAGVTDLDSSYESGKPELRVIVNRDKAADLGVNVAAVANAMRVLVGGDDQVTTYREGDDRYDVQLRVDKEFRDSATALEQLYVPSARLGNVPVSNVAALVPATGPTQIERYNRQRQIFITANLVKGQALSNVVQQLETTVRDLNMPPGYGYGLVGQSKEFGRAAQNFVIAFILSILFMYMVLAAQFESFVDPITILISLPLSVPFALLSLLLMRENFSVIYTSVGILVLFGIVKKNSILQIDHVKALRRGGLPRPEAILAGCMDRLRPILMTTASLVAGMIPLALGGGAGSGSRRTVAIVVIGGQTLCLLLTLLVTPVAYSLFDDLAAAGLWARIRAWFARAGIGMRRLVGQAAGLMRIIPLLVAAAVVSYAQEPAAAAPRAERTYPQVVAPPRVGVTITERRLTLQDAIGMALKNNLDIEIERTNRSSAEQNVVAARGFFDPNFRWVPFFNLTNTPTGSVLQGSGGKLTDRSFGNNFFLRQNLTNQGTQLHADFTNSRVTTTNPFTSFSPLISSQLLIGITQPLLRGRTLDPQRAEIRIRQKNVNVAQIDVELRTIEITNRVEQAYWDLVAARQTAVVAEDSANWAREQLAINQRMVRAGTLAPVELAAAEAELERRLDTLYASVALVTEAENQLKTMIASSRTDEIWGDQIIPVDRDLLKAPPVDNVRDGVETALRRRPELRSVSLRTEVNEIQRDLAKDLTRPGVSFVGQYSLSGLGGSVRVGDNPFSSLNVGLYQRLNELSVRAGLAPVPTPALGAPPDFLVGNYGTALENLFGGRYQSFQVGLQFDLTFGNRTAEANLAQAAIGRKRLELEQARVAQLIEAQVRNGVQGLETARQRIAAAEASVRAAKEKLDSETRLYQTGESTNFLVLTRQNEYADSRRRLLIAQLDFNKSVARLEQALGTTLQAHNIAVR
ncbi:MAG TPA: efflux RND transporter permease subunit, partial [Bryobacteraceae bacterium]|nr:efflux RND transporter permease subunit [Bryobacteraceae bacterium]